MKVLIMLLLLACTTPAFAQTAPTTIPAKPAMSVDERKAVSMLLATIHELPPKSAFEQAATDPYAVLRAISAGQGPIAERAMEAMFYWPDEQTFGIATSQLADEKTRRGRRNRLMLSLAETYGDRATAHVVPFLRHDDAQLRITAAAAIAKIRTEAAFVQLDEAVEAEADPVVAKEMRRYSWRRR